MNRAGSKTTLMLVALVALSWLLREFLHYSVFRLYIDDAYIFMRYAENFAAGKGLVFNPGEPVMGFTSPLYTGLLGLLAVGLRFLPLAVVVNGLNSLLYIAIFWLLFRSSKPHKVVWLMPVVWALYFPYVDAAINGMETMLFIAVVFWAGHLLGRESPTPPKYDLAAFVTILAALVRPEGVMFCVAVLATLLMLRVKPFPWKGMFAGLGVVAAWAVVAKLYYGSVVPQSMAAKSALVTAGLGGSPMNAWDKLVATGFGVSNEVLATLPSKAVWGLWFVAALMLGLFGLGARSLWRDRSPLICIPLFYILVWLFYVVGKPVQLWTWYTIPPSIAFMWTAAIPVGRWLSATRQPLAIAGAAGMAALLLVSLVVGVEKREERMRLLAWEVNRAADTIIQDYPDTQSIAVADIGLLGFKTDRHIVDLAGLVTRSTVQESGDGQLISLGSILQQQRPDLLLLRTNPMEIEVIADAMVVRRTFDDPGQRDWFASHYERLDWNNQWYTAIFARKTQEPGILGNKPALR